ncbi:MAG: hypothetical protein ISQ97_05685 [Flavobacteriales bacterium]|nr:hypothetical protein [Flavobacteriales bacterium]
MKTLKFYDRLRLLLTVNLSTRLSVVVVTSILLTACEASKPLAVTETAARLSNCQVAPFVPVSATQQDALPGVESNVRKQRTYRLEMAISAEEGDAWLNAIESINQWELWVDSVVVPVRFRPMRADMHIAFRGLRMFYAASSEGGMQLPVEEYAHHGTALLGTARLVGYNTTECYSYSLDTLQALPLIVAP